MTAPEIDEQGSAPDRTAAAPAAPATPVALPPTPEPATQPTTPTPARRRWWRRPLPLALTLLLALVVVVPPAIDLGITLTTRAAVAGRIEDVPPTPVALLLGTARTHQGRPNQYYRGRIEAAAALYHSGRVRGILVSGDNATVHYNEPWAMRKDLIARGVPADHITLDYAGFRTLDSMVRAREVFGLTRLVVVSQRFHAERAIFLARRFGIDATGLAAPDPTAPGLMRVRAREILARTAAVLDLLTGRGPRFLGTPETVRLRADDRAPDAAALAVPRAAGPM